MKAFILIENNGEFQEYEKERTLMYSFSKEKLEKLATINNKQYYDNAVIKAKNDIEYYNERDRKEYEEELKEYNSNIILFERRQTELKNDIAEYVKKGEHQHAKQISCLIRETHSWNKPEQPKYRVENEESIQYFICDLYVQRVEEIEIED